MFGSWNSRGELRLDDKTSSDESSPRSNSDLDNPSVEVEEKDLPSSNHSLTMVESGSNTSNPSVPVPMVPLIPVPLPDQNKNTENQSQKDANSSHPTTTSDENENQNKNIHVNANANTNTNTNEIANAYANEYKPASCMQQTMALVRKNLLNKMRTPTGTILELISPALFMFILVLGYTLSDVNYRLERVYTQWRFDIPGGLIGSAITSVLGGVDLGDTVLGDLGGVGESLGVQSSIASSLLEKKLSRFDYLFNEFDNYDNDGDIEEGGESSNYPFTWKNVHHLSRMLQTSNLRNETEGEEEIDDDDDAGAGYADVTNSFNDFRQELKDQLKSPVPIPTLPQYLTLSQLLSSQFNPNELDLVYQTSDTIRRWGNLLTLGTIHISPRGKITDDFINYLEDIHGITNITSSEVLEDRPNATSVLLRVHDDTDIATEYVMNNLKERTFVSINFNEYEEDFQYTLRMNSTTLPNTNEITRWVSIGLSTNYQRYFFSGYLTLQRTINEFAIWRLNEENGNSENRILQSDQCSVPDTEAWDVFTMPMPTPAYSQNPFFTAVGFLLGLSIAMSFLYPVSRLIKAMVEEKETRMKETLSILGVRPLAQWLSWMITASLSSLIIAVFVTMTLSMVMRYSSTYYLFLLILLFSFATSGFGFFIASFFSRANLAAIVGPVALFVTLLPRWIFFGSNRYEAIGSKKWASLFPCTAFAFGADILSDYEYAQVGIQSSNLRDGAYSFNTTLGFLFIDTILYIVLGWYLEQVIPRQYGVAKKWYFLLTPSFWKEVFPCSKNRALHETSYNSFSEADGTVEEGTVEHVSADAQLRISNLVKIYNPKKPPAINNLNLSMYDSEITCLLGHNGAGKSSTISVLTGLYPPTSGDCIIYGKSILYDMAKCRQSMGICPQQNVLFNNLTVLEHLRFFENIKGISSNEVKDRANEVGLGDFFHTRAGQLSGGNKRKLQLAIALAGEPKLVLLDEPTSGMDPYSRRATWELLRQKRHGRVILLTTHFMDEAEVLADRVAILKDGSLQCSGSVLFLKQRFGLGYNMTIVVDKEAGDVPMATTQQEVAKLLEKSIPGTRFIRESARELVFRFPPASQSMFPTLFDEIENKSENLHISSYGVSNTSLEEVFLELADHDEQCDKSHVNANTNQSLVYSFKYMNAFSQVYLLLHKRFTVERRDLKGLFFKIVLPVIMICLVLMVLLIDVPITGAPIELTAELYNTSGTGASIGNNIILAGTRSNQKESFLETMNGFYPSTDMSITSDLSTSMDVSDYLLDGLANGRREFNFGSFILGDTINTTIMVDWADINTEGNAFSNQIQDALNIISPEIDTSLIIETLNQTLISQNITGADAWIAALVLASSEDDSISNLLNETLTFFNLTTDNDQLQEAFVENLFSNNDTITIEGDGWSLFLTEDQLQSYFNAEREAYNMNVQVPVSIMHNTSSAHSVAVFTQTYYDFLFKKCTIGDNPKLSAINQPLPLTSQQSTEVRTILSIIASILLAIPFNYIPAAFAVFVVKERCCKSKHLQLVSGVDMLAYWVSAYIWDMLLYMLLGILAMVGFLSFGDVSVVFTGTVATFFCTWTMIIGYGVSSLPFAYLLSRFFDNPPNAQISIMIIFFITGFVAFNAYFIMANLENTKDIADALRPIFRTWPAYNLGEGFFNLSTNFWATQILSDAPSPFSWDACGRQILLLYALGPPYFLWLMFLEYSSDGGSGGQFGRLMRGLRAVAHNIHNRVSGFQRIPSNDIDEDVLEEERAVKERKDSMLASSPIVIVDLWKTYPKGSLISVLFRKIASFICCFRKSNDSDQKPKIAVNNLSVHVENGTTFGLLGVNGAGKTTTMGILTGDVTPTSGEAYVASYDVTGVTKDGVRFARKNIGFCPQADPLLDLMTGRETLAMFGRLRGIPVGSLDVIVDQLLEKLTLTPHADKVSENYSGGNKRKLSLGIALIGNPKVLFIDESSSGMDPAARRRMWDLIAEAAKERAVILTTHSMEEAEALCNKVAIMINGRIRCLGGVQHLKQKFLGGYTLSISCRIGSSEAAIDNVQNHAIANILPSAVLSERHGLYLKFEVPSFQDQKNEGVQTLGSLFHELQELVETSDSIVSSYSVSQCTLEQVFINLVEDEGSDD